MLDRFNIKQLNKEKRNKKIIERVNILYNQERKRYDDVIATVAEEFSLSEVTIANILKNPEAPKRKSPTQLLLF